MAGLQVDTEGNLWVQDTQRPGEGGPQRWTVFAPDGAVRGTLHLPADLRVAQVGPDWLLGLALDADEVEHVRLYRLHKDSRRQESWDGAG